MNTIVRSIFVSMLMIMAASASADVVQVFACEQDEEASDQALEAQVAKWLAAARTQ
jgi:hypothetical protein